jgi:N-methylhydantoinase A
VCPAFREFLPASTTAVNAAIMPLVSRYLDALESRLQNQGIAAPFYVMQSSGGVMSVQSAKRRPVYKVESGPAAGVIAAGAFALPHGYANIISFDMGGTTAKVGLILNGRPQLSTEFEVGSQAITPLGEGRGSGYPVRTPVIDLVEVSAGGGSEAWIDAGVRCASALAAPVWCQDRCVMGRVVRCRPSPMPIYCSAASTRSFFSGGNRARPGGQSRRRDSPLRTAAGT